MVPVTACGQAAKARFPKTIPTWKMTREQLARVVADAMGVHSHRNGGGWLYSKTERPLVQGWDGFADLLEACGAIVVGRGVEWSRVRRAS